MKPAKKATNGESAAGGKQPTRKRQRKVEPTPEELTRLRIEQGLLREDSWLASPALPHGRELHEMLAHSARWKYDLGEVIGSQFEEYMQALDSGADGPYDLPGNRVMGGPEDTPQPPQLPWFMEGHTPS